jgi:uncharacterized protein YndB with AHSA1/START domain
MNTAAGDFVVKITRAFDAPPARVFDAWVIREEWQSWIGPKGLNCDVPLLDARVGGRYRIIMRLPDGRVLPVGGTFKTLEVPRSLAFSWGAEDSPAREGLITLTFGEKLGRTELTLHHASFDDAASRDVHVQGWNDALDKLEAYLATQVQGLHGEN